MRICRIAIQQSIKNETKHKIPIITSALIYNSYFFCFLIYRNAGLPPDLSSVASAKEEACFVRNAYTIAKDVGAFTPCSACRLTTGVQASANFLLCRKKLAERGRFGALRSAPLRPSTSLRTRFARMLRVGQPLR